MVYADPRRSLGIISSLFPDTQSPFSGRVFGEQRGGAAEILPRIGVEHENQPQLRILSGMIKTYLNLLEMVDIV